MKKNNKHLYVLKYVPVDDRQNMVICALDLIFKEEKDLSPVDRTCRIVVVDYYYQYRAAVKYGHVYTDYGLTEDEFNDLTPFEVIKLLCGRQFRFEGSIWMACEAENPFEVVDIYKKGMMEHD